MDNGELFVMMALDITMHKLSANNLDTQAILNMELPRHTTSNHDFIKLRIELMNSPSSPPPHPPPPN